MSPALNKKLELISRWAFSAFILTLPFQTSLLIYEAEWGRGFFNPYSSISFLTPEFFLLLAGVFFMLARHSNKWSMGDKTLFWILVAGIFVGVVPLLFSPYKDWSLHGLMTLKTAEIFILYMLTVNGILKQNKILKLFIGVMSAEALLGILQVLMQSSLGFHFLGEPTLSAEVPHLAKIEWGSFTWIRAYGTFPHPNILGGFLVMSLLASFLYKTNKKKERELLFAVQFLGLLASCSRSALLALSISLILLCFWYAKKIQHGGRKILGLVSAIFILELAVLFWSRGTWPWNDPAILSRWTGYKEALALFQKYPLGLGWNHYTLFLDQVSEVELFPWQYQPVHNVYLLALTETGIFGFIFAIFTLVHVVKKHTELHKTLSTEELCFKKRIFTLMGVVILVIGAFDHYWLSLEQGRLLLVLILGLLSHFIVDPLHLHPIRKLKKFR